RADRGERDFRVGGKSGADQRAVHEKLSGAGFAGGAGTYENALRESDHGGGLRGATIQRNTEQNLKDFFKKKNNATPKTDPNMNPMDNNDNLEQSPEERAMAADAAATDAETAKLAADLEDLRQTLLRRQADFDNYRKRIEKERADDSKRATARVVEGLIPVIDGFEHALEAHREREYEEYRKGVELIYKQRLDNISRMGVE